MSVPAGVPIPDPSLTPGATYPVGTGQVCVSGYAERVRDVPESEKDAVYAEYGIAHHVPYSYEVDHLIPLELGGSNSERNLWPEPYHHRDGATAKDGLEDYLHAQVCDGRLGLRAAQREIARDWYAAWVAAGRPEGSPAPEPSHHAATGSTSHRSSSSSASSGSSGSCSRGTSATVGGEHKCLSAGEFCSPGEQSDYERYGFSCVADGSEHRLRSR